MATNPPYTCAHVAPGGATMDMLSRPAEGWWEDSDQLNLVAAFLDPKSIGAVCCTCRFTRDNLQDGSVLRWLAELRGLDPTAAGISTVEHIAMAEAMAGLETSISFDQGSLDLREGALPSIRKVVGARAPLLTRACQ